MGRMDGRIVLVTGSHSGIGAACARRFAEEGARVAGFDLNEAPTDDWSAALESAPGAKTFHGDVRDAEAQAACVAEIERDWGAVDVAVTAAGVAGGGPVHLLDPEAWDRTIDINLKGTYLTCRAVLPGMIAARRGSLITIASIEGKEGSEGGSAYNASKGGVVLLTKNMAMDYARVGIRANSICPGFIETPLLEQVFAMEGFAEIQQKIRDAHQLGRFGKAREIANTALFLASDESSFITGQAIAVDGGFTAGHRFGFAKMMGLE